MILDGEERRRAIIEYLTSCKSSVNGTELAKHFGVSRQVIVQDVALLRAQHQQILSTNKGYLLQQPLNKQPGCSYVIQVSHTQEQTFDEMQAVVDYGGKMLDIFVEHDLYGQIRADLLITDINDAREFCDRMNTCDSKPLKVLTGDIHYHTILAPSEKALQMILAELKEKGILN